MKRKKWTEEEESSLISKYSDLMQSGTLSKLKTREKKFEPIAEHVNAIHHLQDSISFPFRWSWRDVSIKIQNMRHQYIGVKQKIRIPSSSPPHFNWSDAQNHWHNFLNYKHVFGDIDLDDDDDDDLHLKPPTTTNNSDIAFDASPVFAYDGFVDNADVLGLGLGIDCDDDALGDDLEGDEEEEEGDEEEDEGDLDALLRGTERAKKGEGCDLGGQMLGLRREERRREMEVGRKEEEEGRGRRERKEWRKKEEDRVSAREVEWEERERMRARREFERRLRVEREFEEERRRRMKMEEKRDEEEMEWREKMVGMQMEHEKQMMQMYADACHGQMHVLGLLVRLVCQFFGSGGDGLGGGMGAIPSQVLQHPGSLVGDNGKTDGSSDAHFM